MQLVSNPWQFDVLVLTNLYGTIVSNLVCGLIGGPGLTAGRNIGPKYAIFEPGTRNVGKELAGKNMANPVAMMRAAEELLHFLKLDNHSKILGQSIDKTLLSDKVFTKDLGGESSTNDVIQAIVKNIQEVMK